MIESVLPLVLACGTALAFDRLTEHAGLTPPNFRIDPEASGGALPRAAFRRPRAPNSLESTSGPLPSLASGPLPLGAAASATGAARGLSGRRSNC